MSSLAVRRVDLLRTLVRHRLLLSAGLAAASVATGLAVLAPPAEAGVDVLRAARDLAAGTALTEEDLEIVAVPARLVPAGALDAVADGAGRLLAAPVRAGEALTDVRLIGAHLLATARGGLVAVPVRLADAAAAGLLHAGARVDVLAASSAPSGDQSATVVASDTAVLAVPTLVEDSGEGALVVLATTPAVAARLAAAAVSSRLSITLRGPG